MYVVYALCVRCARVMCLCVRYRAGQLDPIRPTTQDPPMNVQPHVPRQTVRQEDIDDMVEQIQSENISKCVSYWLARIASISSSNLCNRENILMLINNISFVIAQAKSPPPAHIDTNKNSSRMRQ